MDIVIAAYAHAKSNHSADDRTMWKLVLQGGTSFLGKLTSLGGTNHMITIGDGRNMYFQSSQVLVLERLS
jgi:hypothetical protein